MHALRSSLARATPLRKTTTTTTLAPRPRLVRAMAAAKAPDGTKLDKNTPEAVWRGILTPEEVSLWIAVWRRRWATERRARRSARVAMAASEARSGRSMPQTPPKLGRTQSHACG